MYIVRLCKNTKQLLVRAGAYLADVIRVDVIIQNWTGAFVWVKRIFYGQIHEQFGFPSQTLLMILTYTGTTLVEFLLQAIDAILGT